MITFFDALTVACFIGLVAAFVRFTNQDTRTLLQFLPFRDRLCNSQSGWQRWISSAGRCTRGCRNRLRFSQCPPAIGVVISGPVTKALWVVPGFGKRYKACLNKSPGSIMSSTQVVPAQNLYSSRQMIWPWVAVVATLVAYAPTFIQLAQGPWQTEQEGHGPLILAASLWLVWSSRDKMRNVKFDRLRGRMGVVAYRIGNAFPRPYSGSYFRRGFF